MPTDDERREVARRLRKGTGKGMQLILNVAFSAFEFTGCSERTLNADEAALKLADLIEPEPERTCRISYEYDGVPFFHHIHVHELTCGHDVRLYEDVPRYCPYCGAKVVDE